MDGPDLLGQRKGIIPPPCSSCEWWPSALSFSIDGPNHHWGAPLPSLLRTSISRVLSSIVRSCLGPLQINGPGECGDWDGKFSLYLPISLHSFITQRMAKGICARDSPWFSPDRIVLISAPPSRHPISEGLIQRILRLKLFKFYFRSEEGGNSDEGATPPAPRHCNTRGRVDLPPILPLLPHRTHSVH